MKWIYSVEDLPYPDASVLGGKGLALFQMTAAGLPVPKPLCIGTSAYDLFVDHNHLREKIGLELYRKSIRDMRWEEIWDASLRIKLLFMKAKIDGELEANILDTIRDHLGDRPLAIRSSAPEEDGAGGSFAGLHESYINVAGPHEIVKKIKMVWASLWSDRAVLYRQELGLEVVKSRMAVVVQPFIEGDVSGIMFTRNPLDDDQMVLEAVHGLNQGLVDGAIAPDRWLISRENRRIELHHKPEKRDRWFVRSAADGVICDVIGDERGEQPPLDEPGIEGIVQLGLKVEEHFQAPQDIEWTQADGGSYLLQARPITAGSEETSGDKRAWYLSLTRSYDNLLQLWRRITQTLLPEMDEDYDRLKAVNLGELSEAELAVELRRRIELNERWTATYWSDFIPFAHGVRLFGEVYNDSVEPDDPFEFVALLTGQKMLSTERNGLLLDCAKLAAADSSVQKNLKRGVLKDVGGQDFQAKISRLRSHFSVDFVGVGDLSVVDQIISAMILQYTLLDSDSAARGQEDAERLEQLFLEKAARNIDLDPAELLSMARASYRIRDDDNIHIGRIGQELERACEYAKTLLRSNEKTVQPKISALNLCLLLEGEKIAQDASAAEVQESENASQKRVKARQLQGQPASRGVATGTARVIEHMADLSGFRKGEVLVIDAIDPTMTFFAPLAAAIIERRGGMLIHGAIIAREYGIPCITGIAGATDYITTGDRITVDGYLGICTVQSQDENIQKNLSEPVC